MIATGTDVKPIECVFFMRDVKSRTYFEQMKGRGARTINDTDFQTTTPTPKPKNGSSSSMQSASPNTPSSTQHRSTATTSASNN